MKQKTVQALLLSVAITPLMTREGLAQEVSAGGDQPQGIEEVVITGSRVARDGYSAPTPVTVIGSEQFEQQTSPNVIDFLTTLPAFAGNYTPQGSAQNASSGAAGTASANLRNLGANRTLILLDGQRIVPSTVSGLVDINTIPSQLIERLEVVTGGASAAYGSDAVSGVVNFILDKDFTGIKTDVSFGTTSYGDDDRFDIAISGGTSFADGRGHALLSLQRTDQDGILYGDRKWNQAGWQIINNPGYTSANGQPRRLLLPEIGPSNATPGGIIVSGPLKGTAFGAGGVPYNFTYGDVVSGFAMQGGSWKDASIHYDGKSIDPQMTKNNIFGRVSYNLADNLEAYVQSSYYENENLSHAYPNDWYFGGLRVSARNPFLPESVAQKAAGYGLETLELGSWFKDMGTVTIDTRRKVMRNIVGLTGDFYAAGTSWAWDAYWQHGVSKGYESAYNSFMFPALGNALDSTIDPNTGVIVCRSTLASPGNGCVPFNPFGTGVNDQRALDYVLGRAERRQEFTQDVYAASVNGEPFSTWAGPVSLATGIEHRKESVTGTVSDRDKQKVFFVTNYVATKGSYDVTEAFVETVIPLADNAPFAKSLELNAAVRGTEYSNSGSVTTWKAGFTWRPIDDLLFRTTQSRDIRAPNLNELYNAGSTVNNRVNNPATSAIVAYFGTTTGNTKLVPEKADSSGFGVVYQPEFLQGFSTSVDYWNIKLKGAINSISAQSIVDLCYQGGKTFCAAINGGQSFLSDSQINNIAIQPFNLAEQQVEGIDFESTYSQPMSIFNADWNGTFRLHGLATHYMKNYTDDTLTPPRDSSGQNAGDGPPDWRWNASLTYDLSRFSGTLSARGVSSGVYNNAFIECTSGCPVSTTANPTINNNQIDGATYYDMALNYTILDGVLNNSKVELFANVRNVFNKDPEVVANGPGGVPFDTHPTNPANYDVWGRVFLVGFRIRGI